ncbi:histone H3-like centromeric protein A isoform X3 [Harpegnathos saltator]|uniref:histone H3-like centromeric protein A isoform X3 n=1 Tax=Harpegnathos saltator TaxID=610380 RepID=UPI000948AAC4|nr:histone H3-like centromeric protein A isoform X3 [Harpegnathos saltator]
MVRRKPIPRSHRSHFDASPEGKRNKKSSIIHKKKRLPVLKEIKHLRRTTHLLIPRLPFARLVREIILEIFPRQGINRKTKLTTSIRSRSPSRGYGDVHRTILRRRRAANVTRETRDSDAKRHDSNT